MIALFSFNGSYYYYEIFIKIKLVLLFVYEDYCTSWSIALGNKDSERFVGCKDEEKNSFIEAMSICLF